MGDSARLKFIFLFISMILTRTVDIWNRVLSERMNLSRYQTNRDVFPLERQQHGSYLFHLFDDRLLLLPIQRSLINS